MRTIARRAQPAQLLGAERHGSQQVLHTGGHQHFHPGAVCALAADLGQAGFRLGRAGELTQGQARAQPRVVDQFVADPNDPNKKVPNKPTATATFKVLDSCFNTTQVKVQDNTNTVGITRHAIQVIRGKG